MTVVRWAETNREELTRLLPDALVVLPIGATEQHGPHLATGTDALLAGTVTDMALDRVDASRPVVLAPTIPVGASDHHFPFGGTLSLSPETLLAVIDDLARSVARCGGRRLVLVNGHGGNRGVCQAAAANAACRHGVATGYVDYWMLATGDAPIPGHAGEFETSLVLAARPELVADRQPRDDPGAGPRVSDVEIHAAEVWSAIDGYTDDPVRASAERGKAWLDECAGKLADRLAELARQL